MALATTDLTIPWWLFLISTLAPFGAVLVSLWVGLWDMRVKAKAEAVEADVKLLQAFGALAPIAAGRGGEFFSESVAQKLLEDWKNRGGEFFHEDLKSGHIDLRGAVANGPVDAAQQAAVIAAIGELAVKHKLLREPGRAMLSGLREVAESSPEPVQTSYQESVSRLEN
jgi:hypothetical protein